MVSFFPFFLSVRLWYDDKKKTPALAFFDAKMIYHKEGLQTQIYLHPENTFFRFYGK